MMVYCSESKKVTKDWVTNPFSFNLCDIFCFVFKPFSIGKTWSLKIAGNKTIMQFWEAYYSICPKKNWVTLQQ
jgi:hypothetical protein